MPDPFPGLSPPPNFKFLARAQKGSGNETSGSARRGLWSAGKGAVGEGVDRGAVGEGVGTGSDKLSIVQGKLQVANEQLSSCRSRSQSSGSNRQDPEGNGLGVCGAQDASRGRLEVRRG